MRTARAILDRAVHRLLRLGVLAAAPWPLAWACWKPQLVRAYPRRAAVRAAYLAAYASAVGASAVFLPLLLVPFGVAAAVGALTGLWLARPSSGRSRRLPPGSLSLVPVRQFVDEDFRWGPISKTTWPTVNQPVVCVHGLRLAADILRDHSSRLTGIGIAFDPLIPAGFLRNMAADSHRHYKRLLEEALTDDLVDAQLPTITLSVDEALTAIAAENCRGADPRAHLIRATVTALVPLLLGVDRDSAEAAAAAEIYESMGRVRRVRVARFPGGPTAPCGRRRAGA